MPTPVIPPPPTPPSAYRIMKNYAVKARQAGFVSEDAVALRIHFHIHCQKKNRKRTKENRKCSRNSFPRVNYLLPSENPRNRGFSLLTFPPAFLLLHYLLCLFILPDLAVY